MSSEIVKTDEPASTKEVELKNIDVEAKAVKEESEDPQNQLSSRAVQKRQKARADGVLTVSQVKGQYIKDESYPICCCGVSTSDFFLIVGLFIFAYFLMAAYFVALSQVIVTLGSYNTLWMYFVLFLIFLCCIGFAVYSGNVERTKVEALAAKELKEGMNV